MNFFSRMNKSIKILSVTAAFGLNFAGPALALDSNAFIDHLQNTMSESGLKFEPGKVSMNGDNITIDEAKITTSKTSKDNVSDEVNINIKNVVFSGVEEDNKGDYTIKTTKVDEASLVLADKERSIIANNIEINKLLLTLNTKDNDDYKQAPYQNFLIKQITLNEKEEKSASIDDVSFVYTQYDLAKAINLEVSVGNVYIDVASLDPSLNESLTKMGFKTLEGQGKLNYDINFIKSYFNLGFHSNVKDAGQLDLNINLGGLNKDLFQELVRFCEALNLATSNESKKAASVGMFGVLQQLSINSIDVKFNDNSLTNKIIDLKKGDNVKREDFVKQIKMLLPLGLAQLQYPEFAEKVNKQVGTYLDNPKNLEILAKPDSQVPFAVVAASAMTSSKKLIDLLKIDVIANQ